MYVYNLKSFWRGFDEPLFRKKSFGVNFFVWGNASFAIFIEKENPCPFFSSFISSNFEFYLMNALVYVDIEQGIYKVKLKVALKWKTKKTMWVFFSISMASFEAFPWTNKLSSNLFFLKIGTSTSNFFSEKNDNLENFHLAIKHSVHSSKI